MTNHNDEQFSQEDEHQETLGPLLKAARESKGMTVKDVAAQLHLRPSIVNDIESDCFSDIASSTYVRGYVKNFTRIVEAPEDRIQACLAWQVPSVTEPAMQSFSRKTSREARENRLMWVTYLIVAILLTLLVVWWVQKSKLLSGTDFSQPTVEEIAESNAAENQRSEQALETVTPNDGNISSAVENQLEPVESAIRTQATPEVTAEVQHAQPAAEQTPTDIVNATQLTAQAVGNAVESTPQQSADGVSQLQISLTGDCWIKATDADGKVLINDLKKNGRTVSVSGKPPFKLVLGAPQVVAIQLDGKPLDMSQFPRNKVARITIPVRG